MIIYIKHSKFHNFNVVWHSTIKRKSSYEYSILSKIKFDSSFDSSFDYYFEIKSSHTWNVRSQVLSHQFLCLTVSSKNSLKI
jgi:hypothetical protein